MNEARGAEAPPAEEPLDEPRGRGRSLGCLTRMLIAVAAAIALIVIIGETFDQGPPPPGPSDDLNAGPAEEYAPSDLTQDEFDHIFIVRLADGSFVVLYDRSTKQQEQGRSDCRIQYSELVTLGGMPQLEGFTGALVEECDGLLAVWRVDGAFASGAGYGDLDRYESSTNGDGNLIIDLGSRTCTRSRGVPGQPPFDLRTCGRGD